MAAYTITVQPTNVFDPANVIAEAIRSANKVLSVAFVATIASPNLKGSLVITFSVAGVVGDADIMALTGQLKTLFGATAVAVV